MATFTRQRSNFRPVENFDYCRNFVHTEPLNIFALFTRSCRTVIFPSKASNNTTRKSMFAIFFSLSSLPVSNLRLNRFLYRGGLPDVHLYNTRSKNSFRLPKCRTCKKNFHLVFKSQKHLISLALKFRMPPVLLCSNLN